MKRTRMFLRLVLTVTCASLGVAPAARAQKMDPRETQARKECIAGRYQVGIDLLAELFAETDNQNYIFNQGRCFEQNGKPDEAILRFREYLRKSARLTAEEMAEAEQHIADCQSMKEQQSPPTRPPSPAIMPIPGSQNPEPTPPVAPTVVSPTPVPSPASQGAGLRTAGLVTASVGLAAAVVGVFLGVEAKSISDEVTSDNSRQTYDRNKDDRGRLYSRLQWVGYGVGGAAVAGGAALWYLGTRIAHAPAEGSSLAFIPILSPNQGGLMLRGGF